jgi:hypothetical protein
MGHFLSPAHTQGRRMSLFESEEEANSCSHDNALMCDVLRAVMLTCRNVLQGAELGESEYW